MAEISREEAALRLPALYDAAADLAIQLEGALRDPTAALTPGQLGAFNQILADARALLPDSLALREDVAEADAATRPAALHHALNTTIVPTLHNALPPEAFAKRS